MDLNKFKDERNLPFLAWQCLTIQLKDRDVQIVIRNQESMDNLIKFLIYNLDTLNGLRGSSIKLQNTLMKESKTNQMSRIKNQIMMKVHKKYMILRIRYKISFIAFVKRKTITELILYQVKKSHK